MRISLQVAYRSFFQKIYIIPTSTVDSIDMIQLIGESLLGLGVLLATPLLLYLLIFRFRDNKTISVLFSVIIGSYILSVYIIIFGMLHLFNGVLILALSLLTTIFIWLILKRSKLTNIESVDIDRSMILTVLLFAVFIIGLQVAGQCFTSDTFGRYLPLGRIIANEHTIPAFHLQNYSEYAISRMPLLYTLIALLFSLFKTNAENLSLGIPLFFTSSTIFLLYAWGKECKDKNVPIFVMIALLLSFSFFLLSPVVLQESILLFFATAMFYLLFKYVKTRENLYLILLSASSALLVLTKSSGIVLSGLVFLALLIKSRNKKEVGHIFSIYLLFNALVLIWFVRNFYYYSNPVFPYLAQLFSGELNHYLELLSPIRKLRISEFYVSPLQFIKDIFRCFPAIIFAFTYMYKNKKSFEVQFVFTSYIATILAMAATAPRLLVRYMYPFIGVLAVFAAIEMSKIYDLVLPKIMIVNKQKIAKIAVVIGIMSLLIIAMTPSQNSRFDEGHNLLVYLQQHEGTKDVRIFGDSGVDELKWYGNYTMITPACLLYIVINNGEPFQLNKSSDCYFDVFKKLNIMYVYDTPNRHAIEQIFIEINNDKEHFELVYNNNGTRLWKVK